MIEMPIIIEFFKNVFSIAWGFVIFFFSMFWMVFKAFWWLFLLFFIVVVIRKITISSYDNNQYDNDYYVEYGKKAYIDRNGYLRFYHSDQLVSRWVTEKKLGRVLRSEEVVHHKNRNKLDNRASNLEVFSNQEEHDAEHRYSNNNYCYYNDDYWLK
ncbi:MAG: HNH endonuclease [Candidatus Pacebacteria bacterium]|nr:HNH endonuclease [Candidatus Paceibacterota bacterium]